jgi:hypothetical protein
MDFNPFNDDIDEIFGNKKVSFDEKTQTYMKNMQLRYYADVGIFDFFELTMDADELKKRAVPEEFDNENREFSYGFTSKDVDNCIEAVRKIVRQDSGEHPHTIRFFAMPIIESENFYLGCVAKITNNGTTYIFSKDKIIFNNTNIKVEEIYYENENSNTFLE